MANSGSQVRAGQVFEAHVSACLGPRVHWAAFIEKKFTVILRCCVRMTNFQSTFGHLDRESANLFFKGPDSKYFGFGGICLHQDKSALLLEGLSNPR